MDRAIDAAAAQETRVGGIDDRVDGERRNITANSRDFRMHGVIFAFRQADSGSFATTAAGLGLLSRHGASVYSSAMPSATPINTPAAPPGAPAGKQAARTPDRRLRLDDILKLMVADGLVAAADADPVARSRTQRYDNPLELIADQKWRSLIPPRRPLTLETLVEWLAGKLGIPYHHIDPLKIDLVAVTGTMSIAYAERYRILPVAIAKSELTVATSEPFVRAWADELSRSWVAELRDRGYDVVGDLEELVPAPATATYADPDRPHQRQLNRASMDAIRALLVEAARLRETEADLRRELHDAHLALERAYLRPSYRAREKLVRSAEDKGWGRRALAYYRRARGRSSRSA